MADHDQRRNRHPLHDFMDDEEYAAEVAPTRPVQYNHEARETHDATAGGAIIGFAALALSILAFFTYPVFFGIGAVLLGFFARSRGATKTGNIAIVLGAIAAVMALVFRIALLSFFLSLF